jgi:hypothetical protein
MANAERARNAANFEQIAKDAQAAADAIGTQTPAPRTPDEIVDALAIAESGAAPTWVPFLRRAMDAAIDAANGRGDGFAADRDEIDAEAIEDLQTCAGILRDLVAAMREAEVR